ncbi:hypothetical protein M427DRAFT_51322 [Gonapodya prolifera JEL478]|uniref:CRAL-TRIO domain-containing protein n=1 Tax=Gonapodya prolifera (strain JEL478) TaxID=1344416 RepID=A0A139AYY7_GONPJ|nr:hypothetical protein M427DRAFT_51322 [Gonapodya prolifera JEL478]|eukprot:KXS21951.1 hypothetical protein M427DRAFT_51322 [Gonapodya prolifera JEL478]
MSSWFDTFVPPHANVQRRVTLPPSAGTQPFPTPAIAQAEHIASLPVTWIADSPAAEWTHLRPAHLFAQPKDRQALVPPHFPPRDLTPEQEAIVAGLRERVFGSSSSSSSSPSSAVGAGPESLGSGPPKGDGTNGTHPPPPTPETSGMLLPPGQDYAAEERKFWSEERLRQFCRAVKWSSVDAAARRAEATIKWRREYQPDRITLEEILPEVSGKNYTHGHDRWGRPIYVMRPEREQTKTYERQIRAVVFHIEFARRWCMLDGVEQIVVLLDFGSLNMFNAPPMASTRMFITVLESHYPEVLGMAHIVNPSWIVRTFLTVVSPFLDPVTKGKAHLVPGVKPRSSKSSSPSPTTDAPTPPSATSTSTASSWLPFRRTTPAPVEDADSKSSDAESTASGSGGLAGFGGTSRLEEYVDSDMVERDFGGTSRFDFDLVAWVDAIQETMKREPKY